MDDLAKSIGERIRDKRESCGFRQTHLAQTIGVKVQTLCDYEHGRTRNIGLQSLIKLADALGVSVDYLLGRAEA